MKKSIKLIISFVFAVSVLCISVFAVGVRPTERFLYIDCQTSQLGNIVIVFPANVENYLSISDSGQVFNSSSSVVNGYVYSSDFSHYQYQVRFNSIGSDMRPQYRIYQTSGTATYYNLNITSINESNIDLQSGFILPQHLTYSLVILCLFVIIFFVIIKARG